MTFRLYIKCLISMIFIKGGFRHNVYITFKNLIKERIDHVGLEAFFIVFERKEIKSNFLAI